MGNCALTSVYEELTGCFEISDVIGSCTRECCPSKPWKYLKIR